MLVHFDKVVHVRFLRDFPSVELSNPGDALLELLEHGFGKQPLGWLAEYELHAWKQKQVFEDDQSPEDFIVVAVGLPEKQ